MTCVYFILAHYCNNIIYICIGFGGGFRSGGFSRGPKVCYDFRDNGSCRFGDDCSYSHESR